MPTRASKRAVRTAKRASPMSLSEQRRGRLRSKEGGGGTNQPEIQQRTGRHTMHCPVSCLRASAFARDSRRSSRSSPRPSFAARPTADGGAAPPRVRQVGSRGWMRTKVSPGQPRSRCRPVQVRRVLASPGMERNSQPVAFFTERSLATYLAVSDRTVRNWIRRGDLPSYKLGAARRIDPADVENFLARRRKECA